MPPAKPTGTSRSRPVRRSTTRGAPARARGPGPEPEPELVRSPRRLPLLLRRAWFGLNQAFRRRLAPLGITPDQYTVLRTLAEQEADGVTQRQLTVLMASDANTVAALVERMERAALVERRPHERDRRAYRIRLGASGEARFRAARAEALRLQEEVMASVPAAQRAAFLAQLDSLATACRQATGA